ncbi:MAG: hypothetical protein R3250_14165, partial [Melioribacteraceae bacterium]|nr:hypothetical protein [Melioribacteraceae bacterium]
MKRLSFILSFLFLLHIDVISTEVWSGYGAGLNDDVFVVAASENYVYAGGQFTTAGGVTANCIARWNKSTETWLPLSSGISLVSESDSIALPSVSSIIVIGTDVYVAGNFTDAGGTEANNIAKWDELTETWSALGEGADDFITAMALLDDNIYMVGNFLNAGGKIVNMFAKYNITTEQWDSLGSGISDTLGTFAITSIAAIEGAIYVGGQFSEVGGVAANNVAMWDLNTSTWSPLIDNSGTEPINGVDDMVLTFEYHDGMMYVGGWFQSAGPISVPNIAKWDGTQWSGVGNSYSDGSGHQINDILVLSPERIFIAVMENISYDGSVRKLVDTLWVKVDGFDPFGGVQALHLHENHIIIGGRFGYLFGNPVGDYQMIARFEDPENPYAYSHISLKTFLEGSYDGGVLTSELVSSGLIPINQPFNIEPWNYEGSEQIPADDVSPVNSIPDFFDNNPNIVDWILVEIRSDVTPESAVEWKACFILSDGTIVDHNGTSPLNFYNFGEYYVVLHHRNHLPIMSAGKLVLKE